MRVIERAIQGNRAVGVVGPRGHLGHDVYKRIGDVIDGIYGNIFLVLIGIAARHAEANS